MSAPTATAAAAPRRTFLTAPRMAAALVTLVLVIGELRFHILPSLWVLPATLGTAMLCETVLSRTIRGLWPNVLSAYIAGNSIVILIKPTAGLWLWPFILGAALSITSKYVLTYRRRHLWNPTNFAITAMVLLAPSSITILSHEWGNELWTVGVIWAIGLVVVTRAKLLHITLTYLVCFVALAGLRAAILGGSWLTEVSPVTGPMYQLLMFFMLTDPRTTVSTRRGRMIVVALVALLECAFRLANDYGLPWAEHVVSIPAIAALAIVGPIAMVIELRRKPAA